MRYKLGIIVPSWNTMMEYEVQRMAGNGTSIHSMRIPHTADTEENVIWIRIRSPGHQGARHAGPLERQAGGR
jgi:maleate cis-trans isomerase